MEHAVVINMAEMVLSEKMSHKLSVLYFQNHWGPTPMKICVHVAYFCWWRTCVKKIKMENDVSEYFFLQIVVN